MTKYFKGFLGLILIGIPLVLHAAPLMKLSKKISKGTRNLENKKVAIMTFSYHNGRLSSGSTIVAERLTTFLVMNRVKIVERRLIQKLLEEKKLSETGVVDPSTAKEIGSVLGVSAIVTGTLADLEGGQTEVNARLINVENGEILSAGTEIIERVWYDRPRLPRKKEKPAEVDARNPQENEEKSDESGFVTPPIVEGSIEPEKKSPGKGMKLSNESFPAGKRIYHDQREYDKKQQRRSRRYRYYDQEPQYRNRSGYGDSDRYERKKSYDSKKSYSKDKYNNDGYEKRYYKPSPRERLNDAHWKSKERLRH